MKERILITGTDGFIGKNLKNELNQKYLVSEINENIFYEKNWIKYLSNYLYDMNPTIVFHVGACSNTLETDVNYIMKLNFEFSKQLSDWSKKNNKKLIYSSSAASYGDNNIYPSNLYGWSKYVAEQYINLNGGVSLRYFNVYGPGEENKGKMSSVIFQVLEHKKNSNDKFILFPNKPKRDFVYVDDIVNANIFASENFKNFSGNFYEVGRGESRPFEDILNILDCKYDYVEEKKIPKGYQFYTCSDKSKWMSGWESKYSLEEGIDLYKKKYN